MPLCIRAAESQRADALLRDPQAVALVQQLDPGFARTVLADVAEETQVAILLRNREFDRRAREFLARHPGAVAVHIGCGLDGRFERVDDGQVEWYDLDLPEVMTLRRRRLGGEAPRYHHLATSVLDTSWMDDVCSLAPRPFLFLAEGVFMYLEEAQVMWAVLNLQQRFPGSELVLDAFSPFFVWANNRRVHRAGVGARAQWGLKRGRDLERWRKGIELLEEWFPFRSREPRLARIGWVRHIPLLARTTGVFHYRLGRAPD